jgi:hypothetical protein
MQQHGKEVAQRRERFASAASPHWGAGALRSEALAPLSYAPTDGGGGDDAPPRGGSSGAAPLLDHYQQHAIQLLSNPGAAGPRAGGSGGAPVPPQQQQAAEQREQAPKKRQGFMTSFMAKREMQRTHTALSCSCPAADPRSCPPQPASSDSSPPPWCGIEAVRARAPLHHARPPQPASSDSPPPAPRLAAAVKTKKNAQVKLSGAKASPAELPATYGELLPLLPPAASAGGVPPQPPGRAGAAYAYGRAPEGGRWAVQRPSSALPQLSTATNYPADSPPRQLQEPQGPPAALPAPAPAPAPPSPCRSAASSSRSAASALLLLPRPGNPISMASLGDNHHSRHQDQAAGDPITNNAPPSACSATGPIPRGGSQLLGRHSSSDGHSRKGGGVQWASPERAPPGSSSAPPPAAQQQPAPVPGGRQQPGSTAADAAASSLARAAPAQQRGPAAHASSASSASRQASIASRAGNAFDVPCSHQMVMPVVVSGAAARSWPPRLPGRRAHARPTPASDLARCALTAARHPLRAAAGNKPRGLHDGQRGQQQRCCRRRQQGEPQGRLPPAGLQARLQPPAGFGAGQQAGLLGGAGQPGGWPAAADRSSQRGQ